MPHIYLGCQMPKVLPLFPMLLPSVPFAERHALPHTSGVYFALSAHGDVLYVGATHDLYARWHVHHRSRQLQDMSCASIAYYVCEIHHLAETEEAMIAQFTPPLNTVGLHRYTQPSTDKIPILVRFDRELLARVDRAAKRRGISRSGWVHYQISRALEAEEG
jgi:hypothetical protein